ncbi:DUF932 domain-containing protein [Nonomuraea polychroma]|uniref:DUF932 domain-containing protein n=1 Tax=Nonomuraea polychroma TaxID=46176 RepID=UPI003D906F07
MADQPTAADLLTRPTSSIVRNANLEDLVKVLNDEHARKIDVIVNDSNLRAADGELVLQGDIPPMVIPERWTNDGYFPAQEYEIPGVYRPTAVCDRKIAQKLGIPGDYLRRCRERNPGLWDDNVNGWLQGSEERYYMRLLAPGSDGGTGIARAMLSKWYGRVDHLDMLFATLDGIRESGAEVTITSCNVTETRMYVVVECPAVQVLAPALLDGYTSPYNGAKGSDNPLVHAGFVITNSETGDGRGAIVPRIVAQVCSNGATIEKEAYARTHVGSELPEGPIQWSKETEHALVNMIKLQARDAVRGFLSTDFLEAQVAALSAKSGHKIGKDPEEAVKIVAKTLKYDEDSRRDILRHFIKSDQMTAGGMMQAVTAAAQADTRDPDTAYRMEADVFKVLDVAARL